MERRYDEFAELCEKADAFLMHPHTLPKAAGLEDHDLTLLLWHFPAFQKFRSWAVYRKRKETILRQVTWDRPADASRFHHPLVGLSEGWHLQPTIEVRDRPLDPEDFSVRMTTLGKISFPLFALQPLVLDGWSSGIKTQGGCRATWPCNGPESWGELDHWASGMREWLESIATTPGNAPTR